MLSFRYKDYTLNYLPVHNYNHITSFISRKILSFEGNQLRVDHV